VPPRIGLLLLRQKPATDGGPKDGAKCRSGHVFGVVGQAGRAIEQPAERAQTGRRPGRKPEILGWLLAVTNVVAILKRKKSTSAPPCFLKAHRRELLAWLSTDKLPARSTYSLPPCVPSSNARIATASTISPRHASIRFMESMITNAVHQVLKRKEGPSGSSAQAVFLFRVISRVSRFHRYREANWASRSSSAARRPLPTRLARSRSSSVGIFRAMW